MVECHAMNLHYNSVEENNAERAEILMKLLIAVNEQKESLTKYLTQSRLQSDPIVSPVATNVLEYSTKRYLMDGMVCNLWLFPRM